MIVMMNDQLLNLLYKENEAHELYEQANREQIERTERELNFELPVSYREFVSKLSNGAYLYGVQEVSSVGDGNHQIYPIQHLYKQLNIAAPFQKVTISDNKDILLSELVPFSLDHNGNAWCFIGDQLIKGEYRVGYLNRENYQLYGVLANFTEWIKILINYKEEVIRQLYDDDFLCNELSLG